MPDSNDTLSDEAPTLVEESESATVNLAPPVPARSGPMPFEEHGFSSRYTQRKLLGRGGMGEVRLCSDARIGRDVAMKVMRPSSSGSTGMRERFEREARLQGQLEHPAIVPVYDLGMSRDGAWFTMKRVRGHTLERIVRGLAEDEPKFVERYTLRRLLVAFVQVTQAIAFAHSRGVVHRDLKPANIMLGDFGEVYVLDWGLGKVLGHADVAVEGDDVPTRAGQRTAAGAVLGTPGYMAPEQALGQHDDLDARTDVYALGAILFELLALEPLHPRGSIDEAIESTMLGTDARPSMRDPDLEIAPELDAVCVRATAIDPSKRYASAKELAAEIEQFLDGERDLTVRKKLATRHVSDARAAMARGARGESMRALNRALALDPDDREALAAMSDLLLTPATEPPPEAMLELERTRAGEMRGTARFGAIAFLSWLLLTPFMFWTGINKPEQWLIIIAMFSLPAAASMWLARRRKEPTEPAGFALLAVCTATIGLSSLYFGPFVLVPGWAAQNTLIFAMHARPGLRRAATIVVGTLALLVPLGLELLGVVRPSFAFLGDTMILHIAPAHQAPTLIALTGVMLALIAIPSLIVARAHDDAWEAKKRLAAHLWHLRQLAPTER
jgi:serine/threonine protein kinase